MKSTILSENISLKLKLKEQKEYNLILEKVLQEIIENEQIDENILRNIAAAGVLGAVLGGGVGSVLPTPPPPQATSAQSPPPISLNPTKHLKYWSERGKNKAIEKIKDVTGVTETQRKAEATTRRANTVMTSAGVGALGGVGLSGLYSAVIANVKRKRRKR
jgi:hypothetical protein